MNENWIRYHVTFGYHRTTITLDKMLSDVLAVKLKETPETAEARRAVQGWLQDTLPSQLGADKGAARGASYWARCAIIEAIMDKRLYRKWEDWFLQKNSG